MASVFKLPVAIAVLGAVEKGSLRLDQDVEIRESDRRKIGPLDDEWKPGMRVTVARMVDVMLVDSDNTAADKLIALLGGPSAVEKALASRGVTGIRISLDEKGMGDAMRKDLAAFEKGAQNGASPDAMAEMLARLFRGELLPRARTDVILDAMRRCATSAKRLPGGSPRGNGSARQDRDRALVRERRRDPDAARRDAPRPRRLRAGRRGLGRAGGGDRVRRPGRLEGLRARTGGFRFRRDALPR